MHFAVLLPFRQRGTTRSFHFTHKRSYAKSNEKIFCKKMHRNVHLLTFRSYFPSQLTTKRGKQMWNCLTFIQFQTGWKVTKQRSLLTRMFANNPIKTRPSVCNPERKLKKTQRSELQCIPFSLPFTYFMPTKLRRQRSTRRNPTTKGNFLRFRLLPFLFVK